MSGIDLSDDDVVSMDNPSFGTGTTFKVSELKAKIREFANIENKSIAYINPKVKWFTNTGAECKILKAEGGGWQSGRLRFCLEFIPDEPLEAQETNSPLDDLRTNLDI